MTYAHHTQICTRFISLHKSVLALPLSVLPSNLAARVRYRTMLGLALYSHVRKYDKLRALKQ